MTEHAGLKFEIPPTTSLKWTNDNIIQGVIEQNTYGQSFPGIVIDIGANIGSFACLAAKTATHVYAYEPSSLNFEYLEKNIALNNMGDKVTARHLGLGAGEETLYLNPINCGAFSTFNHYATKGETETIQCIPLDEILEPFESVDWLKMDCEGAEWAGLFNCTTLSKVKRIVMELHFHAPEQREQKMVDFLRAQGFSVTVKPANVPTASTISAERI